MLEEDAGEVGDSDGTPVSPVVGLVAVGEHHHNVEVFLRLDQRTLCV